MSRKRREARPGGRAMDLPVQQEFTSTRATPNCTLGISPCRVCIKLTLENDRLRDQLSFWDTYLVSPEVVNGVEATNPVSEPDGSETMEQSDQDGEALGSFSTAPR